MTNVESAQANSQTFFPVLEDHLCNAANNHFLLISQMKKPCNVIQTHNQANYI